MKDLSTIQKYILEAESINEDWRTDAVDWLKMYEGDQWDETDKAELENQNRPVLTFNILRPLVRLLTGLERKTRYDMKVLPVGEGSDNEVARLLTGFTKQVENDNMAQYVYSEAYRLGLITGRGWIRTGVDYTRNLYGDIVLEAVDPYDIFVDPYARRYDQKDARYMYRDLYLIEDEVLELYPQFKNKLNLLVKEGPDYGDNISQQREPYHLREMWYKEFIDLYYLVRQDTGDMVQVPAKEVKQVRAQIEGNDMVELLKFTCPEIYYVVLSGNEILEQGKSPYNHGMFPYAPFFPDFTPRFGTTLPQWSGLITDLMDPQREKNKRRSQDIDILLRFINTGWLMEAGAVENEDELDESGRAPGFKVIAAPGKFDKVKRLEGLAPNQALLNRDAVNNQDIQLISGIHPSMLGMQESSRESGRTVMLRQQQGSAMISPYQDNMRLTRKLVAQQIVSLIQQVYTMDRMVRMVADNQTLEQMAADPAQQEKLQGLIRIKQDLSVGRYDVSLAESPSTPTTRQMEFAELMDMLRQGVIPMTPNIAKLLIKTSDIAVKGELLSIIEQEIQQAQQQQEQQQIQKAILGGK